MISKKVGLLSLFLCSFSLCNCTSSVFNRTPETSGKAKEEYDVSKNVEYDAFLNEELEYKDVIFSCHRYYQYIHLEGAWSKGKLQFVVDFKESGMPFDLVDIYYADLKGEQKITMLSAPLSCKSGKYTLEYDLGETFADNANDHPNVNIDGDLEFRVITSNGANMTFHLWSDATKLQSNGKSLTDYNITENKTYKCPIEGSKYFITYITKKSGLWLKDRMIFNMSIRYNKEIDSIDLLEVYFTDASNNDKVVTHSKPASAIKRGSSYSGALVIDDVPSEYYSSHDKVVIHFITDKCNIEVCNWEKEELNDVIDRYDTSGKQEFTRKDNEDFECDGLRISYTHWGQAINLRISGSYRADYKILSVNLTDSSNGNRKELLEKPMAVLLNPTSVNLRVNILFDFYEYFYSTCNESVLLHILTEDVNLKYEICFEGTVKDQQPNGRTVSSYSMPENKEIFYAETNTGGDIMHCSGGLGNSQYRLFVNAFDYMCFANYKIRVSYEFSASKESIDLIKVYFVGGNNNEISVIDNPITLSGKGEFYFRNPLAYRATNPEEKIEMHVITEEVEGVICFYPQPEVA